MLSLLNFCQFIFFFLQLIPKAFIQFNKKYGVFSLVLNYHIKILSKAMMNDIVTRQTNAIFKLFRIFFSKKTKDYFILFYRLSSSDKISEAKDCNLLRSLGHFRLKDGKRILSWKQIVCPTGNAFFEQTYKNCLRATLWFLFAR